MKPSQAADFVSIYTVVFHPGQNLQSGSNYSWDFNNDGVADSTEIDGSYVFPGPGSYSVKLTRANTDGSSDSFLKTITIGEVLTTTNVPPPPPPPPPPPVPDNWLDAAWKGRIKVTVAAGKFKGAVTDFPIYINLADLGPNNGFWSKVTNNCGDIRITTADGKTELPREIVECDLASKTGELYFKAAGTLVTTVDNAFYIYYANPAAVDYAANAPFGRQQTWASSFLGVWHLSQAPNLTAPQAIDSTKNARSGTSFGSMPATALVAGIAGKAWTFDGVNDFLRLGGSSSDFNLSTAVKNCTITMWTKRNNTTVGSVLWSARAAAGNNGTSAFFENDGKIRWIFDGAAQTFPDSTQVFNTANTWNYHGFVWAGSTKKASLYGNALLDSTIKSYAIPQDWTHPAGIKFDIAAHGYVPNQFSNMVVDEIRISNNLRNSAWIRAEYDNQKTPSSFYTLSSEEYI